MVTIVKHEWHQVDEQYAIELDESLLSEIYPDKDEDEITNLLKQIEDGEVDVEEVMEDAWENDVDIDWDHQLSDCWTMRKGGYDITYELGDDSSWHTPESEPIATHKCTNCKWDGQSYDADWVWTDKEGNELSEARKVCPYCESDVELTEHGVQEEKEREARYAKIHKELDDIKLEDDDES